MKALFAMVVLLAVSAPGQADQYQIDPSHTRILFDIDHMGYSRMPGVFRNFDVSLSFDPEKPAASSLSVTVRTESIDTYYEPLNEHLRSADFFDVEQHPEMSFTSRSIEMLDDNHARISGDFTLLGVTKPLIFEVTLNQLKPNPMNNRMRVGFRGEGTVDRTAFGMDYAAPLVGADVHFTLSAEADRLAD